MLWTKIAVLIMLLCGISLQSFGQKAKPKGYFHQEKAKLGEPIQYSLVLKHSSNLEFYFPDSTHDFSPFEYLDRSYFPTITDSLGQSYDSIVYSVATFELGEIQTLRVPVFLKGAKNPRPIYPQADSIRLVEVIEQLPDSIRLFENTTPVVVEQEFNYPIAISLSIAFLLMCLFVYLVFGGSIRNYFLIKKMGKQHLIFLTDFDRYVYEGNEQEIEPAVKLWKSYSGDLLNVPLTSYTTKEISRVMPEEHEVVAALKSADMAIYAGQGQEGTKEKMTALKRFSQKSYEQKTDEIKKDKGDVTQLPSVFRWLPALEDPTAHAILYGLFSLISYIFVISINQKSNLVGFVSTLVFPFIAFLLLNYLSILAQYQKTKTGLFLKNTLLQLYGQALVTGFGAGLTLVTMSLVYSNGYQFLAGTSYLKVGIIFLAPLLKAICVSIILPLYYYLFHKENK